MSMKTAMKWTRIENPAGTPAAVRVYGAEATVHFTDIDGNARQLTSRFRIATGIGIPGTAGAFRADRGGMCGWEAIDDGRGFRTLGAAKAFVARWVAAANEQLTLNPRTAA